MHNTLVYRYAKALIEAANDNNVRQKIDAEINTMQQIFVKSPDFPKLMHQLSQIPKASLTVTNHLIKTLNLSSFTGNLITLLHKRKRMALLPDIVDFYLKEIKHRDGVLFATVTSARQLLKDETAKIQDRLNTLTGHPVEITWKQDETILGGMFVKIGDRILDYSLKTHLKQLEKHLLYG